MPLRTEIVIQFKGRGKLRKNKLIVSVQKKEIISLASGQHQGLIAVMRKIDPRALI
jgi:hypothetical protein